MITILVYFVTGLHKYEDIAANLIAPSKLFNIIVVKGDISQYNRELSNTIDIINSYKLLTDKNRRELLKNWGLSISDPHANLVSLNKTKKFGHFSILNDVENQCDLSKLDIFLMIEGYEPIFHTKHLLETVYNGSNMESSFSVGLLKNRNWPESYNGVRYSTRTTDITVCSFDPPFSSKSLNVMKWLISGKPFAEIVGRARKHK